MQLKSIMTRDVEVVRPDASLNEVARRMRERDTGVVPVCDGRRILGMVTDRDIVLRAIADNRDTHTTRARDVMSHDVIYCFEDESIRHAAHLMQEKQIRRLAVLDRAKNLVGIVSLGDLAVGSGRHGLSGATLESVSEASRFQRFSDHRRMSRPGAGSLFFGSALLGLGYLFYSRPELVNRFRQYLPEEWFGRVEQEVASRPRRRAS
jgi:CBS domain-containing protein